jgi:hypothetical protein
MPLVPSVSAAAKLEAIRGREASNLGFIRQITESRHTGDKGPFTQWVHVDYIGVTGIK